MRHGFGITQKIQELPTSSVFKIYRKNLNHLPKYWRSAMSRVDVAQVLFSALGEISAGQKMQLGTMRGRFFNRSGSPSS
jgi:hypothetical protein